MLAIICAPWVAFFVASAAGQDHVAENAGNGLPATIESMRPVMAAFDSMRTEWGSRLCFEDGALAEPWARRRGMGPAGVQPGAVRTLDLSAIAKSDAQTLAIDVLALSERSDPLLRFNVRDVAGCATVTPVSRRMADGVGWEAVTPVLDRTIAMSPATTYRELLARFGEAMVASGLEFVVNDQGARHMDAPCDVQSGPRVARDVLEDILRCAPWPNQTFTLLTPDGAYWVLTLSVAEAPWSPMVK